MRKVIPIILSFLTQSPRYIPVVGKNFEWSSSSWTHNLFRAYELVCGRKWGIRLESTSWNGGYAFYTFESFCAYTETWIRNWMPIRKFHFVPLPKFVTPQGVQIAPSIFSFAIAFDAKSSGGTATSTTNSVNHTCTGSDLVLTTLNTLNGQDPTDVTLSTVVWNTTESLTKKMTSSDATVSASVTGWYLANPTTGAHAVLSTSTSAVYGIQTYNASFSGANTGSPTGASSTGADNSGTGTTTSHTLTTSFDNSFIVDALITNGATGALSATGTNQTLNATLATNRRSGGSYQSTTTAGSKTQSYSAPDQAQPNVWANMEIRELAAVAATSIVHYQTLLGVGQ